MSHQVIPKIQKCELHPQHLHKNQCTQHTQIPSLVCIAASPQK